MAGCCLPRANHGQFHFIHVTDFEKWIGSCCLPQHLKFKTANLVWWWREAWFGGWGDLVGVGGGGGLCWGWGWMVAKEGFSCISD